MTARARGASDRALDLAGVRFLRSFDGTEPSAGILSAIREGRASGVTVFRARNVGSPAQVREIAERKMPDLNANDLDAASKIIAGTARSMGVDVK